MTAFAPVKSHSSAWRLRWVAALFVFLTLSPLFANAQNSCSTAAIIAPSAKLYAKAMTPQQKLADYGITIKFGAKYENQGFPVYRLDRMTYWSSLYRLDDNGHGDPRIFSRIMGRNAAAFFGHLVASNDSAYVPGALFINRSITRYNEQHPLEKQIPVKFFSTDNIAFEDKSMVKAWAEKAEYPLAESGYYQVHDASFHHLAIILPSELAAHSQKIYRLLDDFWSSIAQKDPELLTAMNLSEKTYYAFLAKQIDALGNLHMLEKDLPVFKPYFFTRFLFDGKTPEQALLYTFLEKYRHDPVSDSAMRVRLEEFLKGRGETLSLEQILAEAPSYSAANVRKMIVSRRDEIRNELRNHPGSLTLESGEAP